MSWRDGNRFNSFWKKIFPDQEFDTENIDHNHVKIAYEQGYSDGFKEAQNYDPRFDAD
jgi:hypothetical protein